jgi:hypothetical protein
MLSIRLKSSQQVSAAIPRFNSFLNLYSLSVLNQIIDDEQGSIELLIGARLFGEVKMVTQFAYSFFGSGILNINSESTDNKPVLH